MGIQRKPMSTLQELLESQPEGNTPRKVARSKLPTPPPTELLRADLTDHKRKMEQKGKEVVETGKCHPS